MARARPAQRAAAAKVNATLAALLSPARAEASRRNGAKSKGPKTREGKARSARNALKHGLRAERFAVVGDEDPQQFAAFEAAMLDHLAPQDTLQTFFAGRIVRAAWRLERADQIEAEMFAREMKGVFGDEEDLGLALIRDGNGARAFDTLLRYRASAQAEVFRSLRTLKALQAEAAAEAAPASRAPAQRDTKPERGLQAPLPNQPEPLGNPGDSPAEAVSAGALPTTPLPERALALVAAHGHRPADRHHASGDAPRRPNRRSNPKAAQILAKLLRARAEHPTTRERGTRHRLIAKAGVLAENQSGVCGAKKVSTARIGLGAAWPRPQIEASAIVRHSSSSSAASHWSRSISLTAFSQPTRHGVHWPQLSSAKKRNRLSATALVSSWSDRITTACEPTRQPCSSSLPKSSGMSAIEAGRMPPEAPPGR